MAKKLKRKFRKNYDPVGEILDEAIKKTGRIKRKMYKKMKCAFHNHNGERCKRNAVGSSTLCEKHGGIRVDIDNTFDDVDTKAIVLSDPKNLFQPENHPITYIELSREGNSDAEIAAVLGVSVQTLKNWSEAYRPFAIAYEVGQAMQEAWWLRKGKGGLESRYFNTSLYKFLTGNKLGYSDKTETRTHSTHVHGVLLVPDKVSAEQWEADYVDGEVIEDDEGGNI